MNSENTTHDKATRHDTTPKRPKKPIVNARPLAALMANAAVVGGATLAAAGGMPAVLSGAAAVGVASAAAVGTRKTKTRRASPSAIGRSPKGSRTRSLGARLRKGSGLSSGAGKSLGTGRKSISPTTRTRKIPGTSLIPRALRRKTPSGTGTKPFRTPSVFRKAAAKTRNAATGTRKMTAPVFRNAQAAAAGTRKAARKTGTGFRWLAKATRNLWRRFRKTKPAEQKTRKIPATVADPRRKTAPRMTAGAAVPPAPARPAIPAQTTRTGRTNPVSIAAARMQELAEEMLTTAAAFREQLAEAGSGIGLMHYADDLITLPDVLRTVSEALGQYHQAAEDHLPVAGLVADAMGEVRSSQSAVADAAEAASSIIETVHADELERLRNPQPNAHKADVTENVEV